MRRRSGTERPADPDNGPGSTPGAHDEPASTRRRRRWRRWAAWIGGSLGLLLLLVLLALTWVLTTSSGLRFALAQAQPYIPDSVHFDAVEGRLIGPLTIRDLEVDTASARVSVQRIRLEWAPLELLRPTLHVQRLGVDGVRVTLTGRSSPQPEEPATGPPGLPDDLSPPIAVAIDDLGVTDVTIEQADKAGTTVVQRIQRVHLRGRADDERIALQTLELDAPEGGLEGQLRVATTMPQTVSGRIDWNWQVNPQQPRIAGVLQLDDRLRDLRIDQRLTAPTAADLEARLQLFADDPSWQARLRVPTTRPADWLEGGPELTASADLQLHGTFERAEAHGGFRLGEVPGGAYSGRLDLAADAAGVRLDRLELRPDAEPKGYARLAGSVTFAANGPRFDLGLTWEQLRWPLDAPATLHTRSGRVVVVGTPDDYSLHGEARATPGPPASEDTQSEPPARIQLAGSGSRTGLASFSTRVDWQATQLAAQGRVDWQSPGSLQLRAELSGFEPQRFTQAVSGKVDAALSVEAQWGEGGFRADARLQQLGGQLNGQPLAGSARVRYDSGALALPRLQLTAGDARIEASGRMAEKLDFDWSVEVPDLETLVATAGGRLQGSGSVGGTPDAPAIQGTINGRDLRWQEQRLQRLALTADVGLAPARRSSVELELRQLITGGQRIARVDASLKGTRSDHQLELALDSEPARVNLRLSGGLKQANWRGRLEQVRLELAQAGDWSLAEPAAIRWVDGKGRLGRACFGQSEARLCVSGRGGAADWTASVDGQRIPLALAEVFSPEALEYAGELGLKVSLAGGNGPVTGTARVDISGGGITGPVDDERTTLLAWKPGRIDVTLGTERVDARVQLPLEDGGRVAATLGLGRADPAVLGGQINVRIDDLSLLAALTPQIGRIDGGLVADIGLDGTLAAPQANGQVTLQDGRVTVIPLGIELSELALDLETVGDGVRVELGAHSGDGRVRARLTLRRNGEGGFKGEGSIQGEDFRVVDLPEYAAVITPDLQWQLAGDRLEVTGSVAVPSARIEPRDLSSAVTSSPDAEIVNPGAEQKQKGGLKVVADVEVSFGDDVRVDAFGLDGRLAGNLRVHEQPGELTSGTGELRIVDGKFSIYKQTLEIVEGRVLFDGGPVASPALDIRAVRRPRNIIVGVDVRGTPRQPKVTLFSEPPMSQSNQLSYLIAGVPLSDNQEDDGSSIGAAAAALANTEQGKALTQSVGVDEVKVDYDDDGGASFVLGRYLSPRLYVGYGIGLAEKANSVRMRYDLTERWSLEGRSGGTSSADLLYSIETD